MIFATPIAEITKKIVTSQTQEVTIAISSRIRWGRRALLYDI